MKQNTTTLDQVCFSSILQIYAQGKKGGQSIGRFVKQTLLSKELLRLGAASVGIGSILLLSFYLFLSQLAEHGW